jgi:hypothetical protein
MLMNIIFGVGFSVGCVKEFDVSASLENAMSESYSVPNVVKFEEPVSYSELLKEEGNLACVAGEYLFKLEEIQGDPVFIVYDIVPLSDKDAIDIFNPDNNLDVFGVRTDYLETFHNNKCDVHNAENELNVDGSIVIVSEGGIEFY